MNEKIISGKKGLVTCQIDGNLLHSLYDPVIEAQRFVNQVQIDYHPEFILVTGSGLPYSVPFLRQRFPRAVLITIQYSMFFIPHSKDWDYVFLVENTVDKTVFDELFSIITEDNINTCLFLSWLPSQSIYPQLHTFVWEQIKILILKAKDILATRMYFNKRWIKNTVTFFKQIQEVNIPHKTTVPIILAASGPSLKKILPLIKKYRSNCILLAVSSALSPLLEHNIYPDILISTDGGYWAKEHLRDLSLPPEKLMKITLALSAESNIASLPLSTLPVLPLCYGDGIEFELFNLLSIPHLKAYRNGTVSGTAVQLALELTSGPVFCCGLDLAPSKGFTHTQPNCLENLHSVVDNRLNPKETRLSQSSFANGSLELYFSWFNSMTSTFNDRVYRVRHTEYKFENTMQSMPEMTNCELASFFDRKLSKAQLNTTKTSLNNSLSQKKRLALMTEYFKAVQSKIVSNVQECQTITDPQILIWLNSILLGDFLTHKKNQTPLSTENKIEINTFIQTILNMLEASDG